MRQIRIETPVIVLRTKDYEALIARLALLEAQVAQHQVDLRHPLARVVRPYEPDAADKTPTEVLVLPPPPGRQAPS